MKKLYLSAFALLLTLNTMPSHVLASDAVEEQSVEEKSVAPKKVLPIDSLAADHPKEAVKIAKTQNDLSEFLKQEIASAIKAHYPFLAIQLKTLRNLGVDPATKCRPLLLKAYNDDLFFDNDLAVTTVEGFTLKGFPYEAKLLLFLKGALAGRDVTEKDISSNFSPNSLSFESYKKIETHIKTKLEEFIVMVIGSPLKEGDI